MKKRYFCILTTFFLSIILTACNKDNYLPKNLNETVHYEVIFKDKEQKIKKYRQSYFVIQGKDNKIILLKNDGELMSFQVENTGIEIQTSHYTENKNLEKVQFNRKTYLPLPVRIGSKWIEKDKTTLKLKLGYDRVYNSNLPVDITNEIIGEDFVKLKNGKNGNSKKFFRLQKRKWKSWY